MAVKYKVKKYARGRGRVSPRTRARKLAVKEKRLMREAMAVLEVPIMPGPSVPLPET